MNIFTLNFSNGLSVRNTYQVVSDGAVSFVELYIRSKHGDVGRLSDWTIVQIPMCYEGTDGKIYEVSTTEYNRPGSTLIVGGSSVTYPNRDESLAKDEPKKQAWWKRFFG